MPSSFEIRLHNHANIAFNEFMMDMQAQEEQPLKIFNDISLPGIHSQLQQNLVYLKLITLALHLETGNDMGAAITVSEIAENKERLPYIGQDIRALIDQASRYYYELLLESPEQPMSQEELRNVLTFEPQDIDRVKALLQAVHIRFDGDTIDLLPPPPAPGTGNVPGIKFRPK